MPKIKNVKSRWPSRVKKRSQIFKRKRVTCERDNTSNLEKHIIAESNVRLLPQTNDPQASISHEELQRYLGVQNFQIYLLNKNHNMEGTNMDPNSDIKVRNDLYEGENVGNMEQMQVKIEDMMVEDDQNEIVEENGVQCPQEIRNVNILEETRNIEQVLIKEEPWYDTENLDSPVTKSDKEDCKIEKKSNDIDEYEQFLLKYKNIIDGFCVKKEITEEVIIMEQEEEGHLSNQSQLLVKGEDRFEYSASTQNDLEPGYVRANSNNLPRVDLTMILSFLSSNPLSAKPVKIKALRNAGENYGDKTVGNVRLHREEGSPVCTIKGKITPEQQTQTKGYEVIIVLNEEEEEIISCKCKDCKALEGDCQHATAFLFWLHRRAEDPSNKCEQPKSSNTTFAVPLRTLFDIEVPKISRTPDKSFLQQYLEKAKEYNSNSLLAQMEIRNSVQIISLHCLGVEFIEKLNGATAKIEDFTTFCKSQITDKISQEVEELTRNQHRNNIWYEVRYGRITASKAYETSRCKTFDGALIETIFGSAKFESSAAMKKKLELKDEVLKIVKERKSISYRKFGNVINPFYPFFVASPDAITKHFCIEIKCTSKEKPIENYLTDDIITMKAFTEIQMQMFLCYRKKGLFCVAAPDFQTTKNVKIIETHLDENFCHQIIKQCSEFFAEYLFEKLLY